MAEMQHCKTCRFWEHIEKALGECRRFPPVVNFNPNLITTYQWPETVSDDWCGEYEVGRAAADVLDDLNTFVADIQGS